MVTNVLYDSREYEEYNIIERIREANENSGEKIPIVEAGAGSNYFSSQQRKIGDIARISAVNRKFGQLLFRLVKYYKQPNIIELGTSLGISTLYLARGNSSASVRTIEANENLANRAKNNFERAQANNIEQFKGLFKDILPGIIETLQGDLFVFIDGHHNEKATLSYFNLILQKATENSIFVFDDINWSDGMRNAWNKIYSDARVTLSVDLFFMGIIFFKKGIIKQNFKINF